MSKPETVKEWVNYIYDKLTIAERTGTWVAEGLQKIEVEYERLEQQRDAKQARLEQMDRFLAYHGHIEEFYEVLADDSLWMHHYINDDLPLTTKGPT